MVDETGMVGSREPSWVVADADWAGAQIVLVGDPEQLQPIWARSAFQAMGERVGVAELGEMGAPARGLEQGVSRLRPPRV